MRSRRRIVARSLSGTLTRSARAARSVSRRSGTPMLCSLKPPRSDKVKQRMTDASSSVATPAVPVEVKAPAAETPKEEVKEVAKEAPKQEVSKIVVEDDPVSDTEVEEEAAAQAAAARRRVLVARRANAPPKAPVRGARYAAALPVRSPKAATTAPPPPSPSASTSPAAPAPAAEPARRKAFVQW